MATLYDVYFVPGGRESRRTKVSVVTDPKTFEGLAPEHLRVLIEERLDLAGSYARGSRLEIVRRDAGAVVSAFKFLIGKRNPGGRVVRVA